MTFRNKDIEIEGVKVGPDHPCFIIGEIGSNHCLDKNVVRKLIDACADAKFDGVKFQIYDAEAAFSKNEMTTDVKLDHLYGVKPWWEVARDVILMPRDWFGEMFDYVREKGMIPLSAIHRPEDAEFLNEFGLSVYKIASIDLIYNQLYEKLIPFNKPLLISTGMGYLNEIDQTVRFLRERNQEFLLFHCISQYPPKPEEINLRNIPSLSQMFDVQVGFSDHSLGIVSSVAAVTLGATVIEKHITLDRNTLGPDHSFALEPNEMIALAEAIRETELSLGKYERTLTEKDLSARTMIRRSIVTKVAIKKGERITEDKIKYARPGTGIPTNEYQFLDNRIAKVDIPAEALISWDMVES